MRIPLDYYRILGLPFQATAEQLQQAYRDSILQLPRWEYSAAAIAARKQLLEEAYAVLSDPEQRSRYDANYFSNTFEREAQEITPTKEQHGEQPTENSGPILPSGLVVPASLDAYTPSIEISDDLFVGALLLLQELGEYELVLSCCRPYLSNSSAALESGQKSEVKQVLPDIVLTVALACLELGREQWQQGQYENAATSLENGQNLLLREQLFPGVRSEMQADLDKLRPYLILELLSRSQDDVAKRSQGLELLQNVLQERGGIDGTGDDGSGLSLDDFLRFIQQLRSYLTAAEQQSLFEAESQRPSAVATYLLVYALIARGFAQRRPALIRGAKLMLVRLGKRQDLHLEQAVCSLLLGQTAAASHALELSHEHEPLAFIRENSQGSPDLLPGLCLYSERWLQTEVFSHFRDLVRQQASLKDYFADQHVQAYLEALPTEVEGNEMVMAAPQSPNHTQVNSLPRGSNSVVRAQSRATPADAFAQDVNSSGAATATLTTNSDSVAMVPMAERIARATHNSTELAVRPSGHRSRRRKQNRFGGLGSNVSGERRFLKPSSSALAFGNFFRAKKTRLLLFAVAGILGIGVLGFLVSQISGRLWQAPATRSVQQPRNVPPLPSPSPEASIQLPKVEETLTQETAQQVLQSWLSTKASAFGPDHSVDALKQVLVEPALSQWQRLVQRDEADDRYRQYKHSLEVNSVQTSRANPDQAQVEATVDEVAQVYINGKLNQNSSYHDKSLRVRYDLVRQDSQWHIRSMRVLR